MSMKISHTNHEGPAEPCIVCETPTTWRVKIPVIVLTVDKPLCQGCSTDMAHAARLAMNAVASAKTGTWRDDKGPGPSDR